ncbi:hypothetical protein PM082_009573 [Marasmius tenuissimus]|nr:hypothetical protein PM082_009573 [Marasmius tenuissimus]
MYPRVITASLLSLVSVRGAILQDASNWVNYPSQPFGVTPRDPLDHSPNVALSDSQASCNDQAIARSGATGNTARNTVRLEGLARETAHCEASARIERSGLHSETSPPVFTSATSRNYTTAPQPITTGTLQHSPGSSSITFSTVRTSGTSEPPSPSATGTPVTTGNDHKGEIIGGVLGGVVGLLLLILVILFLRRQRRARDTATSLEKYRQDTTIAPKPETNQVYDDNKDFGYGWNEKAVGVGEKS